MDYFWFWIKHASTNLSDSKPPTPITEASYKTEDAKKARELNTFETTMTAEQIKRCVCYLLGHLYGKYVKIIGLTAPGKYSDHFWSNKISVWLCEGPKPPNSMSYGFLSPGEIDWMCKHISENKRTIMETFPKTLFSKSWESNNLKVLEIVRIIFGSLEFKCLKMWYSWNLENLRNCKFGNMQTWILKLCDFEDLKLKTYTLLNLTIWKMQNWKFEIFKFWNLSM